MWTCSICGRNNLFGSVFPRHQAEKHGINPSMAMPSRHAKKLTPYVRKLVSERSYS